MAGESEVVIKVEGEIPPADVAPVVIVTDPASAGGTDPGTILSLEMLRDSLEEVRATAFRLDLEVSELRSRVSDNDMRLLDVQIQQTELESEEGDESEVVAEVIPEPTPEVATEEPKARKRKWI